MSKKRKNVESVIQVFTLLHFVLQRKCPLAISITHNVYTYSIILKLFIFGWNIMALLLCERQQNWLRVVTMVFRTIGIFFIVFSKSKKSGLFTFLPCFVHFLELWCQCLSIMSVLCTVCGVKCQC